jgi:formylglycine-generating enzyme required for sulfatase activity
MIEHGAYCIDGTEVTNAQYQAFLDANVDLASQPAYCAWNTSYTPSPDWPFTPGLEPYPVGEVDWCDAYAYCAWAGKHLCRAIQGYPADFGAGRTDPVVDQWYAACSNDGALLYPYGQTFEPTWCNNVEYHNGWPTVRTASLPNCQGGSAGLFDMSGNVSEWEDSCQTVSTGGAAASDRCSVRGGSMYYGDVSEPGAGVASVTRCADRGDEFRNLQANDVGFRCCLD